MVMMKIPKKDVQAFLRVLKDIAFIQEAERGDTEIERGRFVALEKMKKGIQS